MRDSKDASRWRNQTLASLPVSAFADDLHLEVIDAAGSRDGVGGPNRRRIFWGFAVTFGEGNVFLKTHEDNGVTVAHGAIFIHFKSTHSEGMHVELQDE